MQYLPCTAATSRRNQAPHAPLDAHDLSAGRERLLCGLVLDELSHAEPLPLAVPMPDEKRLRMLCESVLAHPAHSESLEHWASEVGASTRTISRLFKQEMGMTPGDYRRVQRLQPVGITDPRSRGRRVGGSGGSSA